MATSKEFNLEGSVLGSGDDDIRGDSKRKKFKPLSVMKKFFTKKRDKKDTVVAVKAKSTTALHSGYRTDGDDDDDDDGGFKSHPKPLALTVNRSLSEDSVFSPEPRAAPIAKFPKTAISDESLPNSAFQSELLSKLTKRQSHYSDHEDYHDDGLPRSPVPPVTTADVIMGRPLKKQAGSSSKTFKNRDSDQSLVSVDSSENEEEELFLSKWKSSVSAKKLSTSPATSSTTMDTLDFNSIQKTELLVNRAAKDRITVKPQRKTARQSRMMRESSILPSSLPSLNEESPTKAKPEIIKENRLSGSHTANFHEKVTSPDEKLPLSSTQVSHAPLAVDSKIGPVVSTGSKPVLSSINIISKESSAGTPLPSPTTLSPPVVMPTATVSATATSPKVTISPSPSICLLQNKADITCSTADPNLSTSSPSISTVASVAENTANPIVLENKTEKLSSSERGDKTNLTDISVTKLSQSQRELNESKPYKDIKSRMSQFQRPALDIDTKNITSNTPKPDLPMHTADIDSLSPDVLLTSPTDNYKTRYQGRSMTLPAVIDEKIGPKVQRSRSHRIQNSVVPEPEEMLENAIIPQTLVASTVETSEDTKKPENPKLSADSTLTPTGEPSWISIARKRNADQEINLEGEKTQTSEAIIPKLSTSAPKSVFTSASSYLERKRGSIETISYKNREIADQAIKKIENSDSKHQGVDHNSQYKHSGVDVNSVRRETFEGADVSHLGSVKTSRNIFNASSKSNSQKDCMQSASATVAASERIKQFPSSSSGISITSSNPVKPGSNVGHDPASTPIATDNTKTTSGIAHMWGGSVKMTPTKTDVEVKSSFKSRSGSVKDSTSIITTESSVPSEPATFVTSKAEPPLAVKLDNPGASTTSALPSAPHVSLHVAAQPNTSMPSQTFSVTPTSFYVKPFTAYSSKPATNIASASRPTNAAVPLDIKHFSTSTLSSNPIPIATNNNSTIATISTANDKGINIPTAKASASTSISANTSTSFASSSISSSSLSSPVTTTIPSTSSSTLLPTSRLSSVRPQSSFITSTAHKPNVSYNPPFKPTSTSSLINKSPSFKAVTISTEKVASVEKTAPIEKVASIGKAGSTEKVASEKITDVKKPFTPAKVPAWRTHLSKEVKIEVIENSPSSTPPSSTSINSDIIRHGQKGRSFETPKRTEGSQGAAAETEKRRSSKVLDMVKNFQNLQAPS